MKTISVVLIVAGVLLCFVSSLWMHFAVHHVMHDMMHAETSGIGTVASNLTTAWYLSFVNMVGCVIIFFGIILSIFTGRKQQATK